MASEPATASGYTRINLTDVEDAAVPNGFGHTVGKRAWLANPSVRNRPGLRISASSPASARRFLIATAERRRST